MAGYETIPENFVRLWKHFRNKDGLWNIFLKFIQLSKSNFLSVLQYIPKEKKYQYFAKHLLITSVKPSCHLVVTVIEKSFSTM